MHNSATRKILLERGLQIGLRHPQAIVATYIAIIAGAELSGALFGVMPSTLCYALLIPALLSHFVVASQAPYRRILPVLALAPLMRLLSVTILTRQVPQIYWYAIVGLPLLVAAGMTARLLDLSWRQIGLRPRAWLLQLLIALSGLPLGLGAFLLLRPQPLDGVADWHALLIGSAILLIFTGFTEEVIFRGLLHHIAIDLFGRVGLFYSSALFAIMYIGSLSPTYILFIGLVGLFFGWCVDRTHSIWGVALAHGLLNIGLILMWPTASAWISSPPAALFSPFVALGLVGIAGLATCALLWSRGRGSPAPILALAAPVQPQPAASAPSAEASSQNVTAMASNIERCSVTEAAQRLGISSSTVRKRIKDGNLAAEREGRRWVVLLSQTPATTSAATSPIDAPSSGSNERSGHLLTAEPFMTAGWSQQSGKGWSIGYQGRRYEIVVERGYGTIWAYRTVLADDVSIAVDMRTLCGAGGLLLRFHDAQTYLSFRVDPEDRTFRLEQRRGGSVSVLASGHSDAIGADSDAWNRLAARLHGKYIQLLANDRLLVEINTLEIISGSRYGLLAVADDSNAEVYFDNLEIRTVD